MSELEKLAAVVRRSREEPEEESHWLRNTLAAGAVAAPFAGLIGQPATPELTPAQKSRLRYTQFLKTLQPGDVILSGDTKFSPTKALINAASGSPEGYHVMVALDGKGNIAHSVPWWGLNKGKLRTESAKTDRFHVMRRTDFAPGEREAYVKNIEQLVDAAHQYKKEVATAAKAQGMSRKRVRELSHAARESLYHDQAGITGGVKHLVKPKTVSPKAIEAERARVHALRQKFTANPQEFVPEVMDRAKQLDKAGQNPLRKIRNRVSTQVEKNYNNNPSFLNEVAAYADGAVPGSTRHTAGNIRTPNLECIGGVCSTVPATALPKGKVVVPGKLLSETMPSDYLRSKAYKHVSSYSPTRKTPLNDHVMKHAPLAARAGLGALGAAGVFGVSHLVDKFRNRDQKKPAPE